MKRQRRSTKQPSFPLSGKRKILSFARTGTPLLYPNMHRFGAVRNNCYFKRPLHLSDGIFYEAKPNIIFKIPITIIGHAIYTANAKKGLYRQFYPCTYLQVVCSAVLED